MTQVAGKTVLITGAGMGMGKRHAERAVERGAGRIILWDINDQSMQETAEPLRRSGARSTRMSLMSPTSIRSKRRRRAFWMMLVRSRFFSTMPALLRPATS